MARKGKPADIVRIDLGAGWHTYGQLLGDPFLAVYDLPTTDRVTDMAAVVGRPILFVVAVNHRAVGRFGWPIVGQAPPGGAAVAVPDRFIQDVIYPSNCRVLDADGNARPTTLLECEGLEPAAVWDLVHVTQRLRDHYAGRPNVHLERMRLRLP